MTPPEQNHFTQADREVMIRLTVGFENITRKIEDLTDIVDGRLGDHETRIRLLEASKEDFFLVKKIVYGMVSMILIAFLGAIVTLVII